MKDIATAYSVKAGRQSRVLHDHRLGSPSRVTRRLGRTLVLATVLSVAAWACAERQPPPAEESAPAIMLGEFVDDYGIRYTIQADRWVQQSDALYHIDAWNAGERFVVAQNDSGNSSDGGLWTRIDWVVLEGSEDYEWAFCYAAYRALTRQEALIADPTQRDTPRTGCNGFPFSRMKRVPPVEP